METAVVLCCLTPAVPANSLTEDALLSLLAAHAPVKTLHLFARRPVVKAFVECWSVTAAQLLVDGLHDKNCLFGRLRMYHSQKMAVAAHIRSPKNMEPVCQNSAPNSGAGSLVSSDHPSSFSTSENFSKKRISPTQQPAGASSMMPSAKPLAYSSGAFQSGSRHYLSNFAKPEPLYDKISGLCNSSVHNPLSVVKLDAKTFFNGPSAMLKVNNFNKEVVNCRMLVNLFGTCGNVKSVLFNNEHGFALVEMQSHQQAHCAQYIFHNFQLFSQRIKIRPSQHQKLFIDSPGLGEAPKMTYHVTDPTSFRFGQDCEIRVGNPSAVLCVRNAPPSLSPVVFFDLVSQVHEPVQIVKRACGDASTFTYLVEFESMGHSTEVLAVMHNLVVDGEVVQISFFNGSLNHPSQYRDTI